MNTNKIIDEMVRNLAREEWSAECIGCVDDYIDGVESVVNPAVRKLIESLAEEMIGDEESWRKKKQENGLMYMTGRNDLRAEQRLKVKEILSNLK